MSLHEKIQKIKDQHLGRQNKQVFLVEGTDDVDAYTILFGRFKPDWEQRWVLVAAGNKRQVREMLKLEPSWKGLVDRVEDAAMVLPPNLILLPRFCLESYLIHPDEIWQALPAVQQIKIPGGSAGLHSTLLANLPLYLRHGALWKVANPLWLQLRDKGFPETLASDTSLTIATNDQTIQTKLGEWQAVLNASAIFADFQAELARLSAASLDDQLRLGIHGKLFWEKEVLPKLSRLLGQCAEKERRSQFFKQIQATDLQPMIAAL